MIFQSFPNLELEIGRTIWSLYKKRNPPKLATHFHIMGMVCAGFFILKKNKTKHIQMFVYSVAAFPLETREKLWLIPTELLRSNVYDRQRHQPGNFPARSGDFPVPLGNFDCQMRFEVFERILALA